MRYHALVQLQKTETCPNNQAMEFGCWLFFRRSAVRVGIKRVGAVVRATARPGHPDAIPPNRSAARGAAGAGRWAEMVTRSISNTPILMVRPNSHRHTSYLENRGSAKRRAAVRVAARPGCVNSSGAGCYTTCDVHFSPPLIPCQIKLNPYIAMVTRLAEKNKHSPICCNELVANEVISPECSKVIPSPIPGIAIKQCKKSNFSKSAQSTLNTTDAKAAAGSDVTNKKMIANCDRLRNSGSTACRSTYAQQTTFAINAEMRPAVIKLMVEFPYQRRVLGIAHRSRIAAVTARKEVSNKFYLGNSTTLIFGESSQIPKALSMVDSLRGDLIEAWQSTPFNAASTAKGACHGNGLARESATIYGVNGGLNG